MLCCSSFRSYNQFKDYVRSERVPSKDHINSGLFATHYFNINPELETISELVAVRFFSSQLYNPIKQANEHLFVIGVTGSADGQNRRPKTDVILVIDRSGSMSSGLSDVYAGRPTSRAAQDPVKTKMSLTISAAKDIFDLMDEDECIGIVAFDNALTIVETLKRKASIDRERLFPELDNVTARGGTNMEIGLAKAIEMMKEDPNPERNKRILFLTDACPNAGTGEHGLREMAERAFVASNGTLCVTYIGIGLSFNAEVSLELSRVRGTTITSVNTPEELREVLVEDFNYLVSPVAYNVKFNIECDGAAIDRVYGGDEDAMKGGSLLEFRTLTGSSVRANGVKGSVVIAHLKVGDAEQLSKAIIRGKVEFRPYGEDEIQHRVYEARFNPEPHPVVEKAFALSVCFETLRAVLPPANAPQEKLTDSQKETIQQLHAFLMNQTPLIQSDLTDEIKMIDRLLA
jgi:Ca-activated chloride channel family protein